MTTFKIVTMLAVFFAGYILAMLGVVTYWFDGGIRFAAVVVGTFIMVMAFWWQNIVQRLWPEKKQLVGAASVVLQLFGVSIIALAIQLHLRLGQSLYWLSIVLVGWTILYASHLCWRSLWFEKGGS